MNIPRTIKKAASPFGKLLRWKKKEPFPFVAIVRVHPQSNSVFASQRKHCVNLWNETRKLAKKTHKVPIFTILYGRETRNHQVYITNQIYEGQHNILDGLHTKGDINIVANHRNNLASMPISIERLLDELRKKGITEGKILIQGALSRPQPTGKPLCADLLRQRLNEMGFEAHFSDVVKKVIHEKPHFSFKKESF